MATTETMSTIALGCNNERWNRTNKRTYENDDVVLSRTNVIVFEDVVVVVVVASGALILILFMFYIEQT